MSDKLYDLFYKKMNDNPKKIESFKKHVINAKKTNLKNGEKYSSLITCPACGKLSTKWIINKDNSVCRYCQHHFPLPLMERIKITCDEHSFREMYQEITSTDFLHFKDVKSYQERIEKERAISPNRSAIVVGTATIANLPINIGLLDFSYLGGSLGSAMGEKLFRIIENSTKTGKPLLIFSSSGGCRMQEGLTSLMQMAKICTALEELSKKGILYISILCHPTSGGVAASFSILGDLNMAEPDAMICFAGPRVVKLTIGEEVSDDLLTSETVFKRGMLDCLVKREAFRDELAKILLFFGTTKKIKKRRVAKKDLPKNAVLDCDKPIQCLCEDLKKLEESPKNNAKQIEAIKRKIANKAKHIHNNLTKLQILEISRSPSRIDTLSLVENIFDDYIELHGDRRQFDDPAIVGGLGYLGQDRVVFVGHQKGRDLEERINCNFGMPHPEGYRKARRLFRLAEKFRLPIVTFINTPGAYPGARAEERGQIEAIAGNLKVMSQLTVPIITFVIGEGGSGGALGIGLCNKLYMLEFSYYSVISPEGCSSILYRKGGKTEEAACNLQITAQENLKLKIVDEIIKEPVWLLNTKWKIVEQKIKTAIKKDLEHYKEIGGEDIKKERHKKYREIGCYQIQE